MGLIDKLTELDRYIWKGYEKVTQTANKHLGWNKYDLTKISETTACLLGVGAATYYAILDYKSDSSLLIPSMLAGGFFVANYYRRRKDLEQLEKLETELSELGGVVHPRFNPIRPVVLTAAGFFTGLGIDALINEQTIPEKIPVSSEEYGLLYGLGTLGISGYLFFKTCGLYFVDQLRTPPKHKKKLFEIIVKTVRGKLTPSSIGTSEPAKYSSIDEVIN